MKIISLKVDESVFKEMELILSRMDMPRNRYINEALEFYNQIQKRRFLESRLRDESALVREDSMQVLKDFEEADYGEEEI